MAKKTESSRQATFHRAVLLTDGSPDNGATIDWSAVCNHVENAGLSLRAEDGTIFVASTKTHPMQISMHKPLSPDFLSIINESGSAVADALDALSNGDQLLAHSTAVAFMKETPNRFAIVKGSKSSPGVASVENLLKMILPQPGKSHWKVDPVIAPGDVELLRSSEGVTLFSGTMINGDGSLFGGPTLVESGLSSDVHSVGDYVGSEVELTFQLKLAKQHQTKSQTARFRDLALKLLPGVNKDRPSSAKARLKGGESELKLSPHVLSSSFPVLEAETGVTQFSVLQDEIGRVRGTMEDRVRRLSEG